MQKFEGYIEKERKKTHFGLSISTIFQTCNAGEVNLVNVTIEIIFAAGRFLGFFSKLSYACTTNTLPNPMKQLF